MKKMTKGHVTLTLAAAGVFLLALIPTMGRVPDPPAPKTQKKADLVYVCACLQTKSCTCMTEAKMEGPCACGTQGGPPLKAVPADSAWAKQNRDELAK